MHKFGRADIWFDVPSRDIGFVTKSVTKKKIKTDKEDVAKKKGNGQRKKRSQMKKYGFDEF